MLLWFGSLIGGIGMCSFLVAYFRLQQGIWAADSTYYLGTNLLGAVLLMISLAIDWNAPAFCLELAWAWISLWGLQKRRRSCKQGDST